MTRWTVSRARRLMLTVTVGACALAATAAPAAAQDRETGAAASGYLNLHQCAYYASSLDDHFSTFVTPSGDNRYATGTKRSATADTTASCGSGNGNHNPVPLLHGVKALNLGAGRYLNLQQCDYYRSASTDRFTTLVTPSGDGRYSTGTKVSPTPETTPTCGPGNGSHLPNPGLSGALALDLTAGRYLNLHQCVYYSERHASHLTSVVTAPDTRYRTGTKVSDTADTRPDCGPGNGDYVLIPILSAVKALPLT
ncbi:hypothetical protein [Streptomyces spectabilis]|uniref:Uncharacterized protein n=1 Tax=Streptomyces spectabilis TaxID=68270 RepID=A0A5P2XE07_STRST|nr:hypothetical protein [Streptomyces spectabilis]MBB5105008.1 hypothetical protein [Streptomyces spectabilis]MCI3905740.1 hypothetical protein [Streptomyces spectabilis]QEV62688.1 hypothetical protein CP982_31510 [Streptomyces spectabilis]GGV06916.1 hypothetical protein GCM10010245_14020 [Streptomyces spectabilis]